MSLFFSPAMLPEIFVMAVYHRQAVEQLAEIRRLAKEQEISAKYIRLPAPAK
jgi:hypothetical protein